MPGSSLSGWPSLMSMRSPHSTGDSFRQKNATKTRDRRRTRQTEIYDYLRLLYARPAKLSATFAAGGNAGFSRISGQDILEKLP